MAHSIFISLTKQDTPIAEALREAFRSMLGNALTVYFSTSKEQEGGVPHGEDWFKWIVERVQQCDFALVLLTPASVQKPWILWEAGAVHGAAVALGAGGMGKVRPLLYHIDEAQLPSPIRESHPQFLRGDQTADVAKFFKQVLHEYQGEIPFDQLEAVFRKLDQTVQDYLKAVSQSLLRAPTVPTAVAIEEWLLRLDNLLRQNRQSEVENLQDWMEIGFGEQDEGPPRSIDLRIHTRLGEVYLKTRSYKRAVAQLELARQIAPRDIFVLRTLGRAYLETRDPEAAKAVIERIVELDTNALQRNAECAALAARWHREDGDLKKAADILGVASEKNADSYYLANLCAEVWLEAGEPARAKASFQRALDIVNRLQETNIWTNATAANAAFVVGDEQRAAESLRAIVRAKPDADSLAIVERGLRKLAAHVEGGDERLARLMVVLRPQLETAAAPAAAGSA